MGIVCDYVSECVLKEIFLVIIVTSLTHVGKTSGFNFVCQTAVGDINVPYHHSQIVRANFLKA